MYICTHTHTHTHKTNEKRIMKGWMDEGMKGWMMDEWIILNV